MPEANDVVLLPLELEVADAVPTGHEHCPLDCRVVFVRLHDGHTQPRVSDGFSEAVLELQVLKSSCTDDCVQTGSLPMSCQQVGLLQVRTRVDDVGGVQDGFLGV